MRNFPTINNPKANMIKPLQKSVDNSNLTFVDPESIGSQYKGDRNPFNVLLS
jgi:hypothetical protein